ncbi:MAG: phosphatase PAP2 family protein [Patescibacteria group bacterium]
MEHVDTTIFFWFNSVIGRSAFVDQILIFFANYLAYVLGAAFMLFVIFQTATQKERISILLSTIVTELIGMEIFLKIINVLYERPRPFITLTEARQLFTEVGPSFPSGHATFFFGLSAVLFQYNRKIGIIFFIASTVMVIARVMSGVHYPSDIIAGALLGSTVGLTIPLVVNRFSFKLMNRIYKN